MHTNANGEAYLNWKGNYNNCTLGGGVITHTPFRGVQGSSNGWINSNFAPATHGVNYQRNSSSYGFYSRTNLNSGVLLGIFDKLELFFTNATSVVASINESEWGFSGTVTALTGHFGVVRSGASAGTLYRNGAVVATTTQASTALSAQNIFICCRNNGSGTPAVFSTAQLFSVYLGGALTANEEAILNSEIHLLANNLGAGVI
jgi:hypothetical protein